MKTTFWKTITRSLLAAVPRMDGPVPAGALAASRTLEVRDVAVHHRMRTPMFRPPMSLP